MNSRIPARLVVAAALGAAAMLLPDTRARAAADPATYHMLEVFGGALSTVERQSVGPVDDRKLISAALAGMMASLDAHSSYMTPETYAGMQAYTAGRDGGVGLALSAQDGAVRVLSVADGSPAALGGVRRGDYIVAVDGQPTIGQAAEAVMARLGGESGSAVDIGLIRDLRERLDLRLVRTRAQAVESRRLAEFGYLRVGALKDNTGRDAEVALDGLGAAAPEMKGLVLDLRDCPGGLVSEAVGLASLFLQRGEPVFSEGRTGRPVARYLASGPDRLGGRPMVVLINAGTAAGAEIIAGALQDNGRAMVVGARSFGQGSIQTVIPLGGGRDGALKLTTAGFTTPSGRSIDGAGISPDLTVEQTAGPDVQLDRALAALRSGSLKALRRASAVGETGTTQRGRPQPD